MNKMLALEFKITDWCNLACPHCPENSCTKNPPAFMPLEKIEEYMDEFQELPFNTSKNVAVGGGEGMAPYLFGNEDYIPTVIGVLNKFDKNVTVKTNASWGNTYKYRNPILKSLAKCAYFNNSLITLRMPVDEFHNNISGVSNIIADIVFSGYLLAALRVEIAGFDTIGSVVARSRLESDLGDKEIKMIDSRNDDLVAYDESGSGIHIRTDYVSGVPRLGRAVANHLYTSDETGGGFVNKLKIDNADNAILNNTVRAKIGDRPLMDVVQGLGEKMYGRQK